MKTVLQYLAIGYAEYLAYRLYMPEQYDPNYEVTDYFFMGIPIRTTVKKIKK